MSEAEHRAWEEDLAAYVLDALEPDERAAVETHIDGCERCRGDLRWIGGAVEVLPASVEQREPSAGLRRRLLAAVQAEGDAATGASASGGWREAISRVLRPGLALAAVALLVLGVAVGYLLGGSGGGGEMTVTATATAEAPVGATATVVRDGDAGTLRTSSLPQPRGDGVYQVWIRDGEEIVPSTVFVVDRAGAGVAAIPSGLSDGDEVMVTREPRGGSDAPTTAPLLSAPLS